MRRATTATLMGATTLALLLGVAAPASAATGGVEVSLDGVSYASGVSGSVFTELERMIPGDSQQGTLHVRNTSQQPGFLRIVMSDVSYTDLDFANALTLTTTVDGVQGTPTPVSLADPCWLLTEGQVIPPGGSLAVTVTAALGALEGTRGQGASADIDFGVSLSDLTPGSLSPDNCGAPDVSIPATGGDASATPGPGTVVPADPSGPGSGGLIPSPDGDLPVLSPDGGLFGIDPNTWRLFEEYYILVPIGAALLGGILHRTLVRRPRTAPTTEEARP